MTTQAEVVTPGVEDTVVAIVTPVNDGDMMMTEWLSVNQPTGNFLADDADG